MKRKISLSLCCSVFLAFLIAFTPVSALAADQESVDVSLPAGVLITELQTGLGTGQTDKEYIELYNATEEVVDLSGWQLWYAPESRTVLEAYRTITLDDGVVLQPQQHLLLTSEGYLLDQSAPLVTFEKMLSSEGGNVALLAPTEAVCQLAVHDALAWGGGALGAGDPVTLSPKTKDKLIARTLADGAYRNTGNNAQDFIASTFSGSTSTTPYLGTPGAINTQPAPTAIISPSRPGLDFTQPVADPNCEPPEENPGNQPPQTTNPNTEPPATVIPTPAAETEQTGPVFPERSKGLASPHITEVLPNPAAPQTDAADEFVELYNSNAAVFELTGFKLVAGKRSYTFPAGTLLEPKSFVAYYSADTKLALSNSGGQVQLLDPFGNVIAQTDPYSAAKDGQAWALANGNWQWTTSLTPNAANAIQAPPATSKKKAAASKTNNSTAAAKGASTTKDAAPETPLAGQLASIKPSTAIHPGILALIGVFAILYGIYEYRGDLANKLYQFRAYRAARRSLRQKPEG